LAFYRIKENKLMLSINYDEKETIGCA